MGWCDDRANSGRRSLLAMIGTGLTGAIFGGGKLSAQTNKTPLLSADSYTLPADSSPQPSASQITILHRTAGTSGILEKSLSRAGAVGDGKTLDTEAIQGAIAEIEHNTRFEAYASNTPFLGAGELVWPQGLFLVDDSIRITRSLRLRGEGQAEYSSGARIQQQRPGRDLFLVEPIAQGCSISLDNLVLRANGGGASGGALLRIAGGFGRCNSTRITGVVFATPQSFAIDVRCGDDLLVNRCLFDVSATRCIRAGGSAADDKVTNARLTDNYFFSIAQDCIALTNADSIVIQGNNVFSPTSTKTFLQAGGDVPAEVRNVLIKGNTLRKVECLADLTAIDGFVMDGNIADTVGAGAKSARSLIRCAGSCSGLVLTSNLMKGNVGPMSFYDDSAAAVSGSIITGNSFVATGGNGPALRAANTTGRIGDNSFAGFPEQSVRK